MNLNICGFFRRDLEGYKTNKKAISIMTIFRKFTFDSAHYLPNVPEGHKCRQIHGHTYKLTIFIDGKPDEQHGWVMDFGVLKKTLEPIIEMVDHKLLNNLAGLENPTCELLAVWLWNYIKRDIPSLSKIELNETPASGVIYEG
jgi:6-pyruvoyltetrahydropterin/6-carboxytetrahydropterin synthase